MNEIKIYLKPSGSMAEIEKDFKLYQNCYRNVQISVFVPTEMLYRNTENTFYNVVQTGAILTAPNGAKVLTGGFNAVFVGTVSKDGVEYAEYTQIMPKEYTVYAGNQLIVCNVASIDNTDEAAPQVISVTTSQRVPVVVHASAYLLDKEPLESSEAEVIEGLINDLHLRLNVGNFAARAIYPWSEEYAYGANELVFYPDEGTYGVFLKSLTANNKNRPYDNGVLDTEHWLLVSDFNILTELYTIKEDIAKSAQKAEQSAQAAAQNAAAATQAVNNVQDATVYLWSVEAGMIAVPRAVSDENGIDIAEHFETIESYIPSETSQGNQLADKAFVSSAININNQYIACSTAAATAAKVVTKSGFVLAEGARITVKFTYANTVNSPTLNVNGTGAKAIKADGDTTYVKWLAGAVMDFVYDGTNWVVLSGYSLQGMSVGTVLMRYDTTSPATQYGGSWSQLTSGRFLRVNTSAGGTGGSNSHSHGVSGTAYITFGNFGGEGIYASTGDDDFVCDGGLAFDPDAAIYDEEASGRYVGNGTAVEGSTDGASNVPQYIDVCVWRRTA